MENLEVIETINYMEILTQINENIIKNNNLLEELSNLFNGFNIALLLIIFSMAILVALAMFSD